MTSLRVIVVDDEPLAIRRLQRLIDSIEDTDCVGTAATINAARQLLKTTTADLLLLDIDMPGGSGLELAANLNQQRLAGHQCPAVILTTAHDQHALEAYEYGVSDYLLKPIRLERLSAALQKLPTNTFSQSPTLTINNADGREIITLDSISCCIAEEKYTRIHFDDGSLIADFSLNQLEQRFPTYFIRTHRSALVARQRITAIKKNANHFVVCLRDSTVQPPISRRQRTLLTKQL